MINYNAALDALYAAAAANAPVLALVNSVFDQSQLGNTSGKVLPWLVWQYGATSGERGEMSDLHPAWWIYIAPNASKRTLYTIVAALDTAYLDVFSVAWGRVRMGKPGAPFVDTALNGLQGIRVPLIWRTLG